MVLVGLLAPILAPALRSQVENRSLLLVAMTGYGQQEDRRKSAEAGFTRHLVKPVDPAALAELLAN